MSEKRIPLQIYCKNCGAPAGFDIVHQTYRCAHCGELTGLQEARKQDIHWRTLQKENQSVYDDGRLPEEFSCPSCGALLMFGEGEGIQTCDFCGSKLVRRELAKEAHLPEVIIPFFITPEEARERMLQWGNAHKKTPEGKSLLSNMNKLQGYYLPYQLVRGPMYATVERDSSERKYECAGFLEGTAVNTSRQLDNQVLNGIEPFDWSKAQPFAYEYIAGQKVKLSDISDADTDKRIQDEVAEDFLPEIEKVMQTSGVNIHMNSGELATASALLPVYFIKTRKLLAVMNGQTGRIAVSSGRKKKSFPWVVEPLVYSLILILLLGLWSNFDWELLFIGGIVIAAIIFGIMGQGRTSLVRSILLQTEKSRTRREKGRLQIDEGKDILKNHCDNTPVFYELDEQGVKVPVRLRFYPLGRIVSLLFKIITTVCLPLLFASVIRWAEMEPGERFVDGFHPAYGGAWYVLSAFLVLIYFLKGARRDVYDRPYIYKILENGQMKLMGKRRDRKISMLKMIHVGGCVGFLLGGFLLFLLIGSTAAILS